MKTKTLLLLQLTIISVISGVFLTGCISLHTKSASQKYYSITVPTTINAAHKANNYNLEIYPPQIAAQFSGANFIYRISEINYTNDYYNVFFGFPAEQIQQNSVKYIQASKIFNYASDNIFPLKANYALKSNIIELYADYRDPQTPKAVISIQYALVNTNKEQPTIIFSKTFSENIPLSEKSSNALVNAWSKGLQKVLKQLIQKLGNVKLT